MGDDRSSSRSSEPVPGATPVDPDPVVHWARPESWPERALAGADSTQGWESWQVGHEPITEPIPRLQAAVAAALESAAERSPEHRPSNREPETVRLPRLTRSAPASDTESPALNGDGTRLGGPAEAERATAADGADGAGHATAADRAGGHATAADGEAEHAAAADGAAEAERAVEVGQPERAADHWPGAVEHASADWWVQERTTSRKAPGVRPKARRRLQAPGLGRYRTAGLIALAGVLVVAGSAAVALFLHAATAAGGTGHRARPAVHDPEAVTRGLAAAWVARHISHGVTVSCDHAMCAELAADGFPGRNLRVLSPAARHPAGSGVIVATAAVRGNFGSSLGARWAPAVIASFGSGPPRIDIRVIAPHGATAYRAAARADLRQRKAAGSALLGSVQLVASAAARRQLASGQVDSRLLLMIQTLIARQPIHILAFDSFAPGAAAGTPLRYADLAETVPAAHLNSARYVGSILSLLRAQRPSYRLARTMTVRLASGQTILRIEFAAPSPLGLLDARTP